MYMGFAAQAAIYRFCCLGSNVYVDCAAQVANIRDFAAQVAMYM